MNVVISSIYMYTNMTFINCIALYCDAYLVAVLKYLGFEVMRYPHRERLPKSTPVQKMLRIQICKYFKASIIIEINTVVPYKVACLLNDLTVGNHYSPTPPPTREPRGYWHARIGKDMPEGHKSLEFPS